VQEEQLKDMLYLTSFVFSFKAVHPNKKMSKGKREMNNNFNNAFNNVFSFQCSNLYSQFKTTLKQKQFLMALKDVPFPLYFSLLLL
jgi:hypothetical protein